MIGPSRWRGPASHVCLVIRKIGFSSVSHRDAVENRPELDGMAAAHSSGPARSWMRASIRGLRGQARSVVEALVTAATGDIAWKPLATACGGDGHLKLLAACGFY